MRQRLRRRRNNIDGKAFTAMIQRLIVVLAIFLSGCAPTSLNQSGSYCVSPYRDDATGFLLRNASEVAERALSGEWYVLRDLQDDKFRVVRKSSSCGDGERRASGDEIQGVVSAGAKAAVSFQSGSAPNKVCWVKIHSPAEVYNPRLYQNLAAAGLRYPGVSSVGSDYDVGSQDECAVVKVVANEVIARMAQ